MNPYSSRSAPNGFDFRSGSGQGKADYPSNDAFWWPFRTFSKALLQTQSNSHAYLEANRRLFDEMRSIIRKQQDLAIDISDSVLNAMTKNNPKGGNALNPSEVNQVFDLAVTRMRELGEAWIDVQVRSLDAMRSYAGNVPTQKKGAGEQTAAEPASAAEAA